VNAYDSSIFSKGATLSYAIFKNKTQVEASTTPSTNILHPPKRFYISENDSLYTQNMKLQMLTARAGKELGEPPAGDNVQKAAKLGYKNEYFRRKQL